MHLAKQCKSLKRQSLILFSELFFVNMMHIFDGTKVFQRALYDIKHISCTDFLVLIMS